MKDRLAIVSTFHIKKIVRFYGSISLLLLLIVGVYEQFSFGVTSVQMRVSVGIPIVYGLVELFFLKLKSFRSIYRMILHMGMTTWILALFLYGVIEIYGTTSTLITPLYIVASLITSIGIASIVLEKKR